MAQLWIPIVLSAVLVFVASSIIHMVLKWHNSEYRKLPNEDAVGAAIRAGNAAVGQYFIPHCPDMKQMQTPEMQRKFVEGPIAFIVLRPPGPPRMGSALVQWFVYSLVVGFVGACVALNTQPAAAGVLAATAAAHEAAIVTGAIAFFAYAGGALPGAIWMGKPWSAAMKELLDGIIYAVITGATFAWLWPH
jgi:hypothetical protein